MVIIVPVVRHLGPGPHPSGSPQTVHGKKGELVVAEVKDMPHPTDYRVVQKDGDDRFTVEGRTSSPGRPGRWDLMFTHGDLGFIKEWLAAEGVELSKVPLVGGGVPTTMNRISGSKDTPEGPLSDVYEMTKSSVKEAKLLQPAIDWKRPDTLLEKEMQAVENKIVKRKTEVLYMYAQDGTLIAKESGAYDHVNIPTTLKGKLGGAVLLHNHPGGRGFSSMDLSVLAKTGAAEIRAVGNASKEMPSYLYIFDARGLDKATLEKLAAYHNEYQKDVINEFWGLIRNKKLTSAEAEAFTSRRTMDGVMKIFPELKDRYKVVKRQVAG